MRKCNPFIATVVLAVAFQFFFAAATSQAQVKIGLRSKAGEETLGVMGSDRGTKDAVFSAKPASNELFVRSVKGGGYRIGVRHDGADYHLRVKPSVANIRNAVFQRGDEFDTFHFYPLGYYETGGMRCKIWHESKGVRHYLCFRYSDRENNDAIFRSGFDGGIFFVRGFECEEPAPGLPAPVYTFTTKSPYDCHDHSLHEKNDPRWQKQGVEFYAYRKRLSEMTPVYQYQYDDPAADRFYYSTNPRLAESEPAFKKPLLAFYAYHQLVRHKWAAPVYQYVNQQQKRSFLSVDPDLEQAEWKKEGILFRAMAPSNVNWRVKITGSNQATKESLSRNEILGVLEVQGFTGEVLATSNADEIHAIIHGPFAGPFPAPQLISTPTGLHGYAKKRPGTFAVYQYDYRGSDPTRFFYSMDPKLATEDAAFGDPEILFYAYSRKTDKLWTVPVYHYLREHDAFLRANPSRELEGLRFSNHGVLFRAAPNIDTRWSLEVTATNKSNGDALSSEEIAAALRAEGFTGKIEPDQPLAESLRVTVDGPLFGPYGIEK